jgi:hypothetical protein
MTYYLYLSPAARLQRTVTPAVIKLIERDFRRWVQLQTEPPRRRS